jgi:hypothetical protein
MLAFWRWTVKMMLIQRYGFPRCDNVCEVMPSSVREAVKPVDACSQWKADPVRLEQRRLPRMEDDGRNESHVRRRNGVILAWRADPPAC